MFADFSSFKQVFFLHTNYYGEAFQLGFPQTKKTSLHKLRSSPPSASSNFCCFWNGDFSLSYWHVSLCQCRTTLTVNVSIFTFVLGVELKPIFHSKMCVVWWLDILEAFSCTCSQNGLRWMELPAGSHCALPVGFASPRCHKRSPRLWGKPPFNWNIFKLLIQTCKEKH